eukprot:jgi/Mesvir1/15971/Mv08282-RA.1
MAKPNNNATAKRQPPAKRKSVKSQIRDIERLLKKVATLPESVVQQKQQELAQLQQTAEAHRRQERERKLAVRYHKVKFFERQKVDRRLAQATRELAAARARAIGGADGVADSTHAAAAPHSDSEDEGGVETGQSPAQAVARLEQRVARLQDMQMYIKHFPKGEKYVSLFKGDEDDAERRAKVERLMSLVKANVAAGAAGTSASGGPNAHAAGHEAWDEEDDPDGMGVSATQVAAKQKQKKTAAGASASKPKSLTARVPGSAPPGAAAAVLATAGDGRKKSVPVGGGKAVAREEPTPSASEEEAEEEEEKDDFFMGSSDEEAGDEEGEAEEGGGREVGDGGQAAFGRGRGRGASGGARGGTRGRGTWNDGASRGRGGFSSGRGSGGRGGFPAAKRGRGNGGAYNSSHPRPSWGQGGSRDAEDAGARGRGAFGARGRGGGMLRGGMPAVGGHAGGHLKERGPGAGANTPGVHGAPPHKKAPKDLHETLKLKVPSERRESGADGSAHAGMPGDDAGKKKRKRKHRKKKPQ